MPTPRMTHEVSDAELEEAQRGCDAYHAWRDDQPIDLHRRVFVAPVPPVLDACCGSRMMWFDKTDQRALFCDVREEAHTLCDGRELRIDPDMHADFRAMPHADASFSVVLFDPPHLLHAGDKSWLALKYGKLGQDWREDLRQWFTECFRVLKPHGTLIFKWCEDQIKVSEVLALTDQKPLFGHKSGKRMGTHWICFLKQELPATEEADEYVPPPCKLQGRLDEIRAEFER